MLLVPFNPLITFRILEARQGNGPSRQRRRARRAAARAEQLVETEHVNKKGETEAEEVEFPDSSATAVEAVEADVVAGSE